MTICIPVYGGRWDGWHMEHYLFASPAMGRVVEFPASGRFNSMYMFCGEKWQFIGYREVFSESQCKGK